MYIALGIANLLMVAVFAIRFTHLPPQIPLFYSRPWGEPQLADLWYILLLPIFMNLFIVINIWIPKKIAYEKPIALDIFRALSWVVIISFTSVFLKIVLLVSL